MNFKNNISFDEIKELINAALGEFYSKDSMLLDYNTENEAVAERCMVFRIGWYMLEKMKYMSQMQCFDLDCEYNRNFDHPKGMYRLTLEGLSEKIKDAIPDLLIHKRKSNENNLVIVEFKKGSPSSCEKANDEEKLVYFTDTNKEYGYSLGFYIELHKKSVNIKVFQEGKHKSHLDYIWRP